jgi:polyhydroxybutyrate depolymerase
MSTLRAVLAIAPSCVLTLACVSELEPTPGVGGTSSAGVGGSSAGTMSTGGSMGGTMMSTGGSGAVGGKGGAGGSGGTSATGGTGGAGGTGGTAGAGGMAAAAGLGGAAGSSSSGGSSGASGGMSGDAGMSAGGAGSAAGTSGAGGNGGASGGAGGTGGGKANGSPGCGKSGRPEGGKVYVQNVSWLLFPTTYDGNTPMPVLFGFHGCGSSNFGDASRTEYSDQTRNNVLGTDYVVAIPLAASKDCFNYNTDITRTKALYDDLVANYCVDVDHVFATGHSSGAQFIVQILSGNHTADAAHLKFKGVAPVAASDQGAVSTPTPIMYIQGKNDSVRGGDGKATVDRFVSGNMCGSTSMAYPGVNGCTSGGTQVNPGCVAYSNCMEPTVWCSHNDPAYSNTSHGIPCFAAQAMDLFFKSLD